MIVSGSLLVFVGPPWAPEPTLTMEAIRVWAGHLPTEAYAQSLALTCGDHWRSDPNGGELYAIILQRPRTPVPSASKGDA